MKKSVLQYQNFTFEIHRKRMRSIRLRCVDNHSFIISCPLITPDFVIKNFLIKSFDWICKTAEKYKEKPGLLGLTNISILDKNYLVSIRKASRDSVIFFETDKLIVINSSVLSEAHLKIILEKRLRRLALVLIKDELKLLSLKYGFKYGKITVRNQKSRYGSCSFHGNLNFNWQIILFPEQIFRHVLLHEACHLAVKNHKKEFWNLLATYDPEWKSHNRWLKEDGSNHFIILP